MSELALQLIAENKKSKNKFLDLGNCGLYNYLPDELLDCVWLERLNLGQFYCDASKGNRIFTSNKHGKNTFIGYELEVLANLSALNSLDLRDSQIRDFNFLSSLRSLKSLDLSYNQISDISFLLSLTRLSRLDLSSNQIRDFNFLSSLTNLNSLDLSYNQISNFSFLSSLTNLSRLDLSSNQISDISFLSSLTNLKSLNLSANQIRDFSFLSSLTNLKSLFLNYNQMRDISFLSSLINLNSLELSSSQISDFSFLSNLTNLKSLSLINNQNTDFSFLSNLRNLKSLALINNQISDISFLSSLENLKSLDLSSNQIRDISFLSSLTNLKSLKLSANQIRDISFLSSLMNLNSLDLNINEIRDISFLSSLENLKSLDLSSNQITDISFLSSLRSLNTLSLHFTQNTDFSFLSSLRNLNILSLISSQISDISFLSSLTNLNTLELSYNQIRDISFLSNLTNLHTLYINSNQISDISFLSSLTNLNTLELSENQISDFNFLSSLANLHTLYINSNQIRDIRFLSSLKNLKFLDLRNNQIRDIRFLSSLTNLNLLELNYNQISDISFLSSLKNLNFLDLRNNQISDIGFLSSLTNLNYLALSNNQITDITHILPLLPKGIAISLKEDDLHQKINLYNNPISTPPMHIIEQGNEAILAWFENSKVSELKPFREAKVILLGEPDAGKSNLLNYFISKNFEEKKSVTRGVKIEKHVFQHQGNDYQINFWDFGGQEVQQSVHQYFLTENTLYIIILNAVTDEQPDKYLQFLDNHAPNSPFIIVTNKDDLQGISKLKNNQLITDYQGRIITSNFRISLKQAAKKEWCEGDNSTFEQRNKQLQELFDLVKTSFLKLPHVEEGFLSNYMAVKRVVEDIYENQNKPYLTMQEFREYCNRNGIAKGTEKGLLSQLNFIGTVRYLDQDNLRGLHILNPEWLSDGIYRIITDGDVKNKKLGKIQKTDIQQILLPKTDSDYTYQIDEIDFLVDMMCSFRVAYFDKEDRIIYIPDSFPEDLPTGFNKKAFIAESKHYFFSYDTEIPSYIISRFIVKSFQYVKASEYWNKGIVLEDIEHSLNHCEALIEQNDRKIDIWIKGKDIQSFFVRIREILRNTHEKTFKKYAEMIDFGEENVLYEAIWNYKIDGDTEYKSSTVIDSKTNKLKRYNINEILGRFETKEIMAQKGDTFNFYDKVENSQVGGKNNRLKNNIKVELGQLNEFNEIKEILLDLQEANVNNELWKSTLIKCLDEFTKLEEAEDKSTQKGIINTSFTFLKDVKDVIDVSFLPLTVNENIHKLMELWNAFKVNH